MFVVCSSLMRGILGCLIESSMFIPHHTSPPPSQD